MVKGVDHNAENKGGGCLLHNSTGHDITDRYKFKGFGSKDRFEMVKNNGICFRCLRGYHPARSCKVGKLSDVVIEVQGLCNRNHHPLHPDKMEGILHSAASEKAFTNLLNISTLNNGNQPVTVLWDSGSDISLITHSMAKKLGLKGKNINLSMIKVGNATKHQSSKEYCVPLTVTVLWESGSDISLITHSMAKKLGLKGKNINLSMMKVGTAIEHQSSKEYCVPLTDKTGKVWNVDVVGINEVLARIKKVDLSKMPELFVGISKSKVDCPHGEIDTLIGANYSESLQRVAQTNKGLQLLENQFGLNIRCRHDEIKG